MQPTSVSVNLRPGQLWRWKFSVGEGQWPTARVSDCARNEFTGSPFVLFKRDDVFTVVTLDDAGPYYVYLQSMADAHLEYGVIQTPRRWHVVLLNDALVWFEHPWFEQAELVTDAV